MKWILIGLGLIAGLISVVVVIGMLLPKSHVASRKARFNQTPKIVFDTITDFQGQTAWRTGLANIERLADREGNAVWRETSKRTGPLTMMVTTSDPPHRMVSQIVDNRSFGGTWTYEITSTDAGCELTITERGEIYNPIFRVFARFVFGYTGTMENYLKQLGTKFGEVVEPTAP